MNDLQTVSDLLHMLRNLDSLSEYSIEYGSALLMNLCLRTKGKLECVKDPGATLKILNELIEHDNVQVKTYVNGALYSLLSDRGMREKGQALGLEEQLKYMQQSSDAQLAKQVEFVIDRLSSSS